MKSRRAPVLATIVLAMVCCATRAADPASGRDIAANCANCHGTNGRSVGVMPVLAGRPQGELVVIIKEFRDGKRPSTVMQQLAKGYTDEQLVLIASYLAARPKAPPLRGTP